MKPTVLAYEMIDKSRRNSLQEAMAKLNIDVRFMENEEYELPLAELLEIKEPAQKAAVPKGKPVTDEMLVFCGIASEDLPSLLQALREAQILVARKAMLTKSNQAWNAYQLFDELSMEIEMIRKQRKAARS